MSRNHTNRRQQNWAVLLLGLALLWASAGRCMAEASGERFKKAAFKTGNSAIAVIYSDIGEPYRTVFMQIIDGIEAQAKTHIDAYPVGTNLDLENLKNSLLQRNTKVVIALGRQGMKIATSLNIGIGIVVGGVIASPENQSQDLPVNSLTPDPALLFSNLKELMPAVRRVFAVYDPRQNGWLISAARQAARNQGLDLVLYEAQDLRNAMQFYQDIFNNADSRRDALWLLQDTTTVEESSVLPMVLQESWNRSVTVFSSNFSHVKRGILFSLYPDNAALGRHLAIMASNFLASGNYGEHGIILLREVAMAINLRTANHLGLNPSSRLSFGMVFPEQ